MTRLADRIPEMLSGFGQFSSSDYDLNKSRPSPAPLKRAAILMPIVSRQGVDHFVLTKRSMWLKHHPGQVSFPGGKVEASDDNAQSAALREAHEEIGLNPMSVEVLGKLAPHETVTGFDIQPYIGRIASDFIAKREIGEVDEVFEVPIAYLANPENYRIEGRVWLGAKRYYYVAPYGPYYIWGATARVLKQFADRMSQYDPDG
jgi:8-oxo-dGTP pyrophosphatase MutT (NUDIX family)